MAKTNFWGQLIRDLREEHGISQRKLCRLSGINRSTVRAVEAGKSITVDRIETLLAVFGYELAAFPLGEAA